MIAQQIEQGGPDIDLYLANFAIDQDAHITSNSESENNCGEGWFHFCQKEARWLRKVRLLPITESERKY
jgi:hypothetical protein